MIATPGLIHQDAKQYPRNVSYVRPLNFQQDQQLGICEIPQNSANHPDHFSGRSSQGCISAESITADQFILDGFTSYPTWPVDIGNSALDCSDQSGVVAEASVQGFDTAQEKDASIKTSKTDLKQSSTSIRHIARKGAGLRTCISCHVAKRKVPISAPSYVTPTDLFQS